MTSALMRPKGDTKMLNPIQKRIAEGMNPLAAFLTEATCGEACWHAREEVCRCSCGGKNHGCLRGENGIQPVRAAKIDGFRYELKAVGRNVYAEAMAINNAAGPKAVQKVSDTLTYTYKWDTTDRGAPARVKRATESQLDKWPELASFKAAIAEIKSRIKSRIEVDRAWPELLWVKL
jgi:hypothetical protein